MSAENEHRKERDVLAYWLLQKLDHANNFDHASEIFNDN